MESNKPRKPKTEEQRQKRNASAMKLYYKNREERVAYQQKWNAEHREVLARNQAAYFKKRTIRTRIAKSNKRWAGEGKVNEANLIGLLSCCDLMAVTVYMAKFLSQQQCLCLGLAPVLIKDFKAFHHLDDKEYQSAMGQINAAMKKLKQEGRWIEPSNPVFDEE